MGDILSYAQVGGSEDKSPYRLQAPLRVALANLQKDIQDTKAEITFGLLPIVNSDPSQLTLVFQNLVGNAVKFRSGQACAISRSAFWAQQETVSIVAADNGEGFDPEYALQIFQPFKRLHGPETPGSGIGLATCKRIVERMGGRIWAESAAGKGATFYFALPDD